MENPLQNWFWPTLLALAGAVAFTRADGATSEAPLHIEIPASVTIQQGQHGNLEYSTREPHFHLTYDNYLGTGFVPKLVTTVQEYSSDEDKAKISVAIDAVDNRVTRRIASFSDPGQVGRVLPGETYFVT